MRMCHASAALAVLGLLASIGCQARPTTPLTIAAARGDVAEIERLIATGVDPNAGGGGAFTPLVWAARRGHVAAMRRLVALGANVDATSGVNHWTPLIHALHKHRTKAAIELIAMGADLSGRSGRRALRMAVGYGNDELTRVLLALGVDPHLPHRGGPSLLGLAAAGAYDIDYRWSGCPRHTATVAALLKAAPDLRLADTWWDRYALSYVRRHGCTDMVSLLEPRRASAE